MRNRRTSEIYVITTEVLKAGGDPMVTMLHKLFNTVYDTEKTSKDWAQMMVTPIHKKCDKQTPANYHALSLLSIHSKVFGRVRRSRMQKKLQ